MSTTTLNIPDEAVKLAAEQIRAVAAACCQEAALAANVAGSAEDWMGEAQAALRVAAPLIERAVLEAVVGRCGDLSHDEWAEQIVDRARTRLAELRAGRP